ncbi:MAG: hypothetical protein BroJett018_36730 [Chloroflexota bacterium]|nr:hypothetical protein [Chloroflexota bacterium]NOG64279.1 hypothetical protein [Chloroflexota bacterium]GIK65879.1 MAG: hypothetical protein BroJett018_36730 [Chloroflexota bacterium]
MRVVTNEALIRRNRSLAQISLIVAIGGLAFSFLISNRIAGEESAFTLNCLVFPILFGIIIFSVRMANHWVREPLAWTSIQEGVRGVTNQGVLYHFIFPARHVLMIPQGVYVLFPLFHDRPIIVKDDKWRIPGGMLTALVSFMRQENIGNPIRDAQSEAAQLQKYLDKHLPDSGVTVNPVIVFTHPNARAVLEGDQSVPVVFVKSKDKTERLTLQEFLKNQKEVGHTSLSSSQIEELNEELIYA